MKPTINQVIIAFLLAILSCSADIQAQQVTESSDTEILARYFDDVYGADELLVTGPFYYGPARGSIQGHPFYTDDSWKDGSVEVGGITFDDLKLKYDISINQVILLFRNSDNSQFQAGLRSGNITKVTIGDKTFIPLPASSDSTLVSFAQLLAGDKLKYLLVKYKYLSVSDGSGIYDYSYKENIKQYIYSDNLLVPFRSRRSLLNLYPEFSSMMKQYARNNRIALGKKRYEGRAEWVNYLNTLLADKNE